MKRRMVVLSAFTLFACNSSSQLVGEPAADDPRRQMQPVVCLPAADGRVWTQGESCSCAPYGNVFGTAMCGADDRLPRCVCDFAINSPDMASWWLPVTGHTEDALRDESRWSRVVETGAVQLLRVSTFEPKQRDWLPGSPNMLVLTESNDDSASFLVRDFEPQPLRELRGEFAVKPAGGVFPRVVSLGLEAPQLVLLGCDLRTMWFMPMFDANGTPNTKRWVAQIAGTPAPNDTRWMLAFWSMHLDASGHTYTFDLGVGPYLAQNFIEEETGRTLAEFQAGGGRFGLSDADAIHQFVIGQRGATGAASRELQLTGVVIEREAR